LFIEERIKFTSTIMLFDIMNLVESFRFGKIVINGQKYNKDLIVFPDEVKTNWRLFTRVLEEDRKHPGTIKEEVKNKRFSDLVLAICRSLSIKTKEDDINLLSSFKS